MVLDICFFSLLCIVRGVVIDSQSSDLHVQPLNRNGFHLKKEVRLPQLLFPFFQNKYNGRRAKTEPACKYLIFTCIS